MNLPRILLVSLSLIVTQQSWTCVSHALEVIQDEYNSLEQLHKEVHGGGGGDKTDTNDLTENQQEGVQEGIGGEEEEEEEEEEAEAEADDVIKPPVIENGLLVLNHGEKSNQGQNYHIHIYT